MKKNPYEQDFVRFLSKEYGVGGRGGSDGIDEMHDGKGIRFSKKNKETGETIAVSLKWEQAAVKIANLIDEDNYLNEEEAKEYATLVRFRNERKSANGDDELVKIMARQIVEYGTAHTYSEKYSDYPGFLDEGLIFFSQHTEEIIKEVEKYDEVISATNTNYPYLSISFKLPYCPVWQAREERIRQREEKVKDYVDRFTRQCADGYKPSNEKNVVLTVTADELPENEFLFLKDYLDSAAPTGTIKNSSGTASQTYWIDLQILYPDPTVEQSGTDNSVYITWTNGNTATLNGDDYTKDD